MRPIVLDLAGFGSFREPAHVDFADADFFALVGPTGAGKSTIIDAMTFALFGSVPRWDRKGMVSLALAPTVARGTVKLVFEADGQRYVVARELRRVGGQVSQRAASLERLAGPEGLARPGEETTPLAKDLAAVTEAVERILGLSYDDFCQCVVLPQGQFAKFLHARAGERQEILLRLLGAEHYKAMMARANQRASAAAQRAETIAETLRAYDDATPEAEEQARAAQAALAELGARVTAVLPRIQAGQEELLAAEGKLRQLNSELTLLTAIRTPDDAEALDAGLAAGRTAAANLRDAEKLAEETDREARDSLARGPRRAPLELARERRSERRDMLARLPGLEADVERLAAQAVSSAGRVDTASTALERLRARKDEADRAADTAKQRVERLSAEHAALTAVAIPAEVTTLDERRMAAAGAVAEAAETLREAEHADSAARAARGGAVPEGPLEQASRDLRALRDLTPAMAGARLALASARSARADADTGLTAAREAHAGRQRALDEARRAHVVAGLRPHLVAGEPCPLCEQTVVTLPAAARAAEVADAEARLDEAARAMTAAEKKATSAAAAAVRAEAALEAALARGSDLAVSLAGALDGPLAGAPLTAVAALTARQANDGQARGGESGADACDDLMGRALAELHALVRARKELDRAVNESAAAVEAARKRHRSAQRQAEQAEADMAAARAALRAARDPLVELGAPQVDDSVLAAGWATLARWAGEQSGARAAALAEAREAARQAHGARTRAAADFSAADTELAGLRERAKTAALAEQAARTRVSQLTGRVGELDRVLRDAPGEEEVTAQLVLLTGLEAAAAEAGQALLAARAERAKAEAALARLERAESKARAELSAARDRVVALGAPVLDDGGVLDGWTALVEWAAGQARSRDQDIKDADAAAAAARGSVAQLTGQLSGELREAGIDLAPDAVAASASPAVAGALERARAATKRVEERRAAAADLRRRQQDAQRDQRVARLLGDLLRADRFPRWLVTEAVDVLVADASANLAALSSGQFDLAYEDGDFYVIDHADADSRRSVRTLSGGETFQASLALALALSAQISALAPAGAARLDSIFLDEGFGTLDAETLEVVAATLETLAQGQRMVGVVTHVPALAERVPVRFRVARNARTSTVTRDGFAPEMIPA